MVVAPTLAPQLGVSLLVLSLATTSACGLTEENGFESSDPPRLSGRTVLAANGDRAQLFDLDPSGTIEQFDVGNLGPLADVRWSARGNAFAYARVVDNGVELAIHNKDDWSFTRTIERANVFGFLPDLAWFGTDYLLVNWLDGAFSVYGADAELLLEGSLDSGEQARTSRCSAVAGGTWIRTDGELVQFSEGVVSFTFLGAGEELVVSTSEPTHDSHEDVWYVSTENVGPCEADIASFEICRPRIDWARRLPQSDLVVMRINWTPETGASGVSLAVALWQQEVFLSSPDGSTGLSLIYGMPATERYSWVASERHLWGIPFEAAPGNAPVLRIPSSSEAEDVLVEEYSEIPATSPTFVADHFLVAQLEEDDPKSWNYLDLNLSEPLWVPLPYSGQFAYPSINGGALFFDEIGGEGTSSICLACRYTAVERLANLDSPTVSAEVSGMTLRALAHPLTGWVRMAPDGSGVVSGVGNQLSLSRFQGRGDSLLISTLTDPGAFSMPLYWPMEGEDGVPDQGCF